MAAHSRPGCVGPDREHDVVLTQAEFRPDIGEAKPAWIIGLRNESSKYTYDEIELEAIYKDKDGKVLEKDRMIIRQKLDPGEEQTHRQHRYQKADRARRRVTLTVLGATSLKP
jgi:hypothetical protein